MPFSKCLLPQWRMAALKQGVFGLLSGSKTGTEQLVALANLAIGQYVAARILNYLDHGDPEWDPEHVFAVKTDLNGLLPDKRWLSLRSVPEDIIKAELEDSLKEISTRQSRKPADSYKSDWQHFLAWPQTTFSDTTGGVKTSPNRCETWLAMWCRCHFKDGHINLPGWCQCQTGPKNGRNRTLQRQSHQRRICSSRWVFRFIASPINDAYQLADDWLKVND